MSCVFPKWHLQRNGIAASPGLTLLSVIGDGLQVYEVRADNGGFDGIIVAQLDLNPLAQRRKHFRKNELLVPNRGVAVLLHAGFALKQVKRAVLFYLRFSVDGTQ